MVRGGKAMPAAFMQARTVTVSLVLLVLPGRFFCPFRATHRADSVQYVAIGDDVIVVVVVVDDDNDDDDNNDSEDQIRLIPLSDRTANLEAMILSMMAENNISFSVAPKLVELIRECCNDPKALANVALDRCVAEERKKDLDQQVHVLTTIAKAKSIKQHAIKKAFKRHQSALGGPSKRRKYYLGDQATPHPALRRLYACMPTQCYEHCK
ncbi:hypothetical protein PoB_004471800 [Plakobranchus ocellatus]|uniref:Uncharacterized protein n=1 Tax=Plakobranchus ocellatus TaxID=259542 RepID=A0AAV4BGD2_9GAST|nr:hypothetical protein PoB_004471800 [Plakobranchus ocellatus]